MKSIEMDIGGPVMPRSKSRAIVRSLVELRVLEVAHPRGPHAGGGEPVVEPRGGPATEIGADGLVDRRQHLERHEHGPHQYQRCNEVVTALHRAHERADGDGKKCGQNPAQHEHGPPGHSENAVSMHQNPEERPLRSCAKACDHLCGSPSVSTRCLTSSDPAAARQKACNIDLSIRGWVFLRWAAVQERLTRYLSLTIVAWVKPTLFPGNWWVAHSLFPPRRRGLQACRAFRPDSTTTSDRNARPTSLL